ncbi:MAG TPA: alkaline phosphatase family protein [Gemmatimonadota bacterium]|nr:alkaline phosphatase family protein [Gemmatimonadota bacterium]
MKILVIGLDCAAPEILFGHEKLSNIRTLMAAGCWGRLESVNPPITVPAWMCMSTGRDPGSLGVYGFRNRRDHSYDGLSIVDSRSIRELAMWDQVAREGGRSVVIGVPPSFPPRKVNGVSVSCFMTPDTTGYDYTWPGDVRGEIEALVGEYPVDVKGFRTADKDRLLDEIHDMTRKHFEVVRHFLAKRDWDYFQFVEIGLDRMHHGFWKHHDPRHVDHDPTSPYTEAIRDYYRLLDQEIGEILALLDEETVVLVVSDHGARPLDGGFCVNEWLIREGYLVLEEYPADVTPFSKLAVDWAKTRAWSEGGYYARVFLNVRGREPDGALDPADALAFRDELAAGLEATTGPDGKPLGTVAFRPEEIYRELRNVPPDLIVHFGGLAWRSIGGVGYGELHVRENDTGPDDCNHDTYGAFVLAGPGVGHRGEIQGARLLDIAPTLLPLGGYDVPEGMQGRSLLTGEAPGPDGPDVTEEAEAVIRRRLSGLGYLG